MDKCKITRNKFSMNGAIVYSEAVRGEVFLYDSHTNLYVIFSLFMSYFSEPNSLMMKILLRNKIIH